MRSNVDWSIDIQGGLVILGRETTGTFYKDHTRVWLRKRKPGFVFGFGSVDILVTAGDVEKTATAKLIGPFLLNVQ